MNKVRLKIGCFLVIGFDTWREARGGSDPAELSWYQCTFEWEGPQGFWQRNYDGVTSRDLYK